MLKETRAETLSDLFAEDEFLSLNEFMSRGKYSPLCMFVYYRLRSAAMAAFDTFPAPPTELLRLPLQTKSWEQQSHILFIFGDPYPCGIQTAAASAELEKVLGKQILDKSWAYVAHSQRNPIYLQT